MPGVSFQGFRARFYNYERRTHCETCRPVGLADAHPRYESHGPGPRGTYGHRRVQLLLQSSACSSLWLICGKASQAFVIYFVSLLSKLTLRATIHCSKRNNAPGHVSRDIAPQGLGFYEKCFIFEQGFGLVPGLPPWSALTCGSWLACDSASRLTTNFRRKKAPHSARLFQSANDQLPFTTLPLTVPSNSMMLYSLPSVSTCCRRTSR